MKKLFSPFASQSFARFYLPRLAISLITLLLTFFLILSAGEPPQFDFSAGDISTVAIYAPRDVVDTVSTERKREAAALSVQEQYTIDYDASSEAEKNLKSLLDSVYAIVVTDADREEKVRQITLLTGAPDKATAETLAAMPPASLSEYTTALVSAVRTAMEAGVTDKEAAIASILETFPEQFSTSATQDLLNRFLSENKHYDAAKTQTEQNRAREEISDIVYKKNQEIVRKGTPVTEEQIAILDDLGLLQGGKSYYSFTYLLGLFVFLCVCFVLSALYMVQFRRKALLNYAYFLMIHTVFLLQVFLYYICTRLNLETWIPVSLSAIILSAFFGVRISVLLNLFLAIIGAIVSDGDVTFVSTTLLLVVVAAMLYRRVRTFSALGLTSIYHSIASAVIRVCFVMINSVEKGAVGKAALHGFGSALICSILAAGLIPFFQMLFDIITPLKLTELSDPTKKLLRQLTMEAPGTYHHSLMVSNLAESACDAIGCDGLLARVSALYHDVGKLDNPQYFKENQLGENPHDNLSPEQSATILIRHVAAGEKRAKESRLPRAIRDMIAQHHGTTKTGYFYKLAKMRADIPVNDDDFTYPGPKPQTKEAAVLMLADSCEAAIRSLDDKSPESIMDTIKKITEDKLQQGQFDECPITMREITTVTKMFALLFDGYFHNRVKYDDATIMAEQQRRELNEENG